jgi:hypothetical protein
LFYCIYLIENRDITGEPFDRKRFSFNKARKIKKNGIVSRIERTFEPEWSRYTKMVLKKVFLYINAEAKPF